MNLNSRVKGHQRFSKVINRNRAIWKMVLSGYMNFIEPCSTLLFIYIQSIYIYSKYKQGYLHVTQTSVFFYSVSQCVCVCKAFFSHFLLLLNSHFIFTYNKDLRKSLDICSSIERCVSLLNSRLRCSCIGVFQASK